MSDYLAGAVFAEGQVAPIHFGDPVTEQFEYEAGRALHPRGPVGLVTVTGADRLTWLTTLSSQDLAPLGEDGSSEMLLLDPNGRIQFAMGVVSQGDTVWLLTDPEPAPELAAFLESMKFMSRVEIRDRSADYQVFETAGGASPAGAEATWVDPWPGPSLGGARYFQGSHPGEAFQHRLMIVPADRAAQFVADRGFRLAGSLAAEATRVAAWRPGWTSEVDDRTMPAELDWLRTAVHVSKGCYCGQESVARILNLGKPPRRLTFLQLDGSLSSIPAPGDPVELNGRPVGVITSVARHAEMGPIALALLKRSVDPAAPLTIGPIAAAQELIVPVEGKSDHSPSERPGAGLRRLDHGGRDIRTTGPGTVR